MAIEIDTEQEFEKLKARYGEALEIWPDESITIYGIDLEEWVDLKNRGKNVFIANAINAWAGNVKRAAEINLDLKKQRTELSEREAQLEQDRKGYIAGLPKEQFDTLSPEERSQALKSWEAVETKKAEAEQAKIELERDNEYYASELRIFETSEHSKRKIVYAAAASIATVFASAGFAVHSIAKQNNGFADDAVAKAADVATNVVTALPNSVLPEPN